MKLRSMIGATALIGLSTMAGGASAQGINVVRYLSQETDPAVVRIQREWVKGFLEENPGSDVILESAPAGVINQRIATYVQAGAPLDVVHSDPGTAARLAVEGLLAPLDDVVDALGGREAFLNNRLLIVNDHVYAINQAATSPQLFYRKDLFKAAGIAPPTTWAEVKAAAKALHSDDVIGIALAGGENRMTTIMAGTMLWQNCHDFFDGDLKVILDDPKAVEAAAHYADLLKYSAPDAAAWSFNEPPESFWSGRAAMVIHWHVLDLMMRQNPDMVKNVAVAPVTSNKMTATQTGGRYVALFANSPTLDTGKKWIEYVFTPENAAKLTGMGPLLYPPATGAAMDALRKSDAPTIAAFGDLLFDQVYPAAVHGYSEILHAGGLDTGTCALQATGVVNPFTSVVWNSNLYARAIQKIAYENADPAVAIAEAAKLLTERVDQARKEMAQK
ncbi:MAG: sugar ABC transporter substrate-binding protein [Parvibaculum sp.]|uniref:ABC transporter substrate-binding protein n=1 Tax=Alphaproteobacteria TaxID=28211 RepID=UPI003298B780